MGARCNGHVVEVPLNLKLWPVCSDLTALPTPTPWIFAHRHRGRTEVGHSHNVAPLSHERVSADVVVLVWRSRCQQVLCKTTVCPSLTCEFKRKKRNGKTGNVSFVMTLFHFLPLRHGDSAVGIRQPSPHRLVWTGSACARSRAHCRLRAHTTALRAPSPGPAPLPFRPLPLGSAFAARPHLPRAVWTMMAITGRDWLGPLQTHYFGANPVYCARARGQVEL